MGLLIVSLSSVAAQNQRKRSTEYKLVVDWEVENTKKSSDTVENDSFEDSYAALVFNDIKKGLRAESRLYSNRYSLDFLAISTKRGRNWNWRWYLNYDSASEDNHKTTGFVVLQHNTSGVSFKLTKGHGLNTFRRGGKSFILQATEQENPVVHNNTANTIEVGYTREVFNLYSLWKTMPRLQVLLEVRAMG